MDEPDASDAPEAAEGAGRRGPLESYRSSVERRGRALRGLRGEIRRVEAGRLGSFVVAAVLALLRDELPIGSTWSLSVAAALGVGFVVLVVRHRRLRRALRREETAEALGRLGLLRLARRWEEIGREHAALGHVDPMLDPTVLPDPEHPYLADLDLSGEASVRALFGPTATPTGGATLRRWLSEPAPPAEIRRRQRAARALAPDFDGREALAIEALFVEGVSERSWSVFRAWLEEPPLFGDDDPVREDALPPWSLAAARVLPPVTLLLFALDAVVGLGVPSWSWSVPLAVQGALAWSWGGRLGAYFGRASGSSAGLRRYHALFRAWERYPAEERTLHALRSRLSGHGGRVASAEIRRLERWLDAADSRTSALHVVLAWVLLWDVHVARGLEEWRREVGAHVPEWFEALGELEALSALATLAHDHPDWCWPEVEEGEPGMTAQGLGHPMLPEAVLRTSDVTVDGPGRFLLVTGSNMSGKSTLLRSLGLAAVLAQAGSAVCARRLTMTPLRTFTSMRIQDSLARGVSLFMAELNRLKALVDAADAATERGEALLYLVDEVLQGTNSMERRIAARRIVAHLLEARAIGAVTTHDLSLHEDDRLDRAATKVHFREQVGGPDDEAVLTFDYQLRPGLATSRNALKLLEIVGLGDGEPGGRGPDPHRGSP